MSDLTIEELAVHLDILRAYTEYDCPKCEAIRAALLRLPQVEAEVERLNTWHSTISQVWKDRTEKAEAERESIMVDLGREYKARIKAEAELARLAPLKKAAMDWDGTIVGGHVLQCCAAELKELVR